jgi:hypothetical protein
VGAFIAAGLPHTPYGPWQTAIGTPLAVIGAFSWGRSFRLVPTGWPTIFFFVLLLPMAFYLLLFYFALGSYLYYPQHREVFWVIPFFLLSALAWLWQIRRVVQITGR